MENKEWYGAKMIFKHIGVSNCVKKNLYEERIILVQAVSFNDAIKEAELEATEYISYDDSTKYLEFVNVFKLDEEDKIGNRTEVYSIMRESDLESNDYLDKFYDTGFEKTKY